MAPSATLDYNQIRQNIGRVVSDGSHAYDIADYSIGNECYKLWCRERQRYYLVGVNSLQLYDQVSG
jgi:hypothetical protein